MISQTVSLEDHNSPPSTMTITDGRCSVDYLSCAWKILVQKSYLLTRKKKVIIHLSTKYAVCNCYPCSFFFFYRTPDYDSKMLFFLLVFLFVDPKKGIGQLFNLINLFSMCSFVPLESYIYTPHKGNYA